MNEDDSHQMANILEQMGYRQAVDDSDADVILLNTCSVRAKPEHKAMSKLGELRVLKREKPSLIVGVCGCMAQREGASLLQRANCIDFVLGTGAIEHLTTSLANATHGGSPSVAVDLPEEGRDSAAHAVRTIGNVRLKEFVPVMYGCNNFCSYCVVPYTRGRERSRPADDIVEEVRRLVSLGCREVTLVGQNVNSYSGTMERGSSDGDGDIDFARLLGMVNSVEELTRIRFTTSHPKDLSDSLIGAIASLPKVCEHLHLPLQSGDDDVLHRMARRYTLDTYMALVEKLRTQVAGIALTTDLMVGFPGETEAQFRNTLAAVEAIRYDSAFMFAYNPRPGTAAEDMDGQIDALTKLSRLRELIDLQNRITLERNQELVGGEHEVLVEGPGDKDASKMTGMTRTHKTVSFPGSPDLEGRIVSIRAIAAHPWGFTGELKD